jgi:hypothetical protein
MDRVFELRSGSLGTQKKIMRIYMSYGYEKDMPSFDP